VTPTISGIAAPPRFTRFELAYLLAGRHDASASISREVFGIPEIGPGDPTAEAGASSLVARGLIDERQEAVLPRNEAGLVGFVLGTGQEWISLVVRTPEGIDVVVFVQGERSAFMVRGAPARTLDFVPIEPDLRARDVARDAVVRLLSRNDVDVMIRVADLAARQALFIRIRPEGFGLGRDPVFPGDEEWPAPDLDIESCNQDDVSAAVDSLLGPRRDGSPR